MNFQFWTSMYQDLALAISSNSIKTENLKIFWVENILDWNCYLANTREGCFLMLEYFWKIYRALPSFQWFSVLFFAWNRYIIAISLSPSSQELRMFLHVNIPDRNHVFCLIHCSQLFFQLQRTFGYFRKKNCADQLHFFWTFLYVNFHGRYLD